MVKNEHLRSRIRSIPDFPKQGIVFRDITTLLQDRRAFALTIDLLYERYKAEFIDKVVSVESRGFIFGSALAYKLNAGFIPVRKPGKLPFSTNKASYQLEYGSDTLEIHTDAIQAGERVLIIDDLLATGGTVEAAASLVKGLGGNIYELAFLIELAFLKGRERLSGYNVFSIVSYDTE